MAKATRDLNVESGVEGEVCECGEDHNGIGIIAYNVMLGCGAPQSDTTTRIARYIEDVARETGWIRDPEDELGQLRNYVADLDSVADIETTEQTELKKLRSLAKDIADALFDDEVTFGLRVIAAQNRLRENGFGQ